MSTRGPSRATASSNVPAIQARCPRSICSANSGGSPFAAAADRDTRASNVRPTPSAPVTKPRAASSSSIGEIMALASAGRAPVYDSRTMPSPAWAVVVTSSVTTTMNRQRRPRPCTRRVSIAPLPVVQRPGPRTGAARRRSGMGQRRGSREVLVGADVLRAARGTRIAVVIDVDGRRGGGLIDGRARGHQPVVERAGLGRHEREGGVVVLDAWSSDRCRCRASAPSAPRCCPRGCCGR